MPPTIGGFSIPYLSLFFIPMDNGISKAYIIRGLPSYSRPLRLRTCFSTNPTPRNSGVGRENGREYEGRV
jgi:hypothetical protein